MTIDEATLKTICSQLEAAAQTLDYANMDCFHELEKCADALGEALEWLEEALKRHERTVTRVLVRAEFLVDVGHHRSDQMGDIFDKACQHVENSILDRPNDLYAEHIEDDVGTSADVSID